MLEHLPASTHDSFQRLIGDEQLTTDPEEEGERDLEHSAPDTDLFHDSAKSPRLGNKSG